MRKRKSLSANALYTTVRDVFNGIPDHRTKQGNVKVSIKDALMSGLAVFALKYPSLLKFDKDRSDSLKNENLRSMFSIGHVPSDTQLREIADEINPSLLRKAFLKIFADLQRGKVLERFNYLNGHYLISLDGTGQFSTSKIFCDQCIKKKTKGGKDGDYTYHHQMLGASIVHPQMKQVIPLFPEPILSQPGEDKGDCERNASKRWIEQFRKEHPKLRGIVLEDSLAANGPHIRTLQQHDLRYIITAKEGACSTLHKQFEFNKDHGLIKTYTFSEVIGVKTKKKVTHRFEYLNELDLNLQNPDIKVNFLNYTETIEYINPEQDKKGIGTKVKRFSWITDIYIIEENVVSIMRAGRGRWKIENETFKTLKEEASYNFEHSYGHGKKYLSTVLAVLTILAFLIDQTQEIACEKFARALAKGGKRDLWERMRSIFRMIVFKTWDHFLALLCGMKMIHPDCVVLDTS